MALNKINAVDLIGKLVSQLSDRPTNPLSMGGDHLTAREFKTRQDALGLLVKDRLNDVIDSIKGDPASDADAIANYIKVYIADSSENDPVTLENAISAIVSALADKYDLPVGGIPSDDLSTAVQTLLGKADSAYQKPSGGIPSTDLTEAVQTILTNAVSQSEFAPVKALAEGADKVLTSDSYSALSTLLNGAAKTDYKVGQKILVGAAGVPDVWIYAVSDSSVSYTYTNDSAFEASLVAGTLQIGYFSLRPLEAKTDLTGYATETFVGTAIAANVDATLATTGKSADAKAVGDVLADAQIKPVSIDFSNPILGYVQSSNGNVNTGSSVFYHTQNFSVSKGQKIKVNVQGYDSGVSVLAYYDGTKFVNLVSSIDDTVREYTYTAADDYTVTVSFNINKTHNGKVYCPVVDLIDATETRINSAIDATETRINSALSDHESEMGDVKDAIRWGVKNLVICDKNSSFLLHGNYVDPNSGNYYQTQYVVDYVLLKEYPVQNGQTFIFTGYGSYALFDSEKQYISGSGHQFTTTTTEEFTINSANAKYISVNFYDSGANKDFGLVRVLDHDYQVINMGDSIFGFNCPPYDVSTYIERKCGIRTLNGAFGGSQASVHPTAEYAKFSFHALADAIYDEDFSTQLGANFTTLGYRYKFNALNLAAVDFSKVKVITVAYGTNDWNNDDQLDNESNKYDTTTYLGAIRYGIEKILSKYPHINIILCSPIYRGFTNGDSDDTPNYNGVYLYEFGEGLKSVAEEYHLPFVDNYHDLGLNALTASTLLISDKTHPNAAGVKRLAGKMASVIEDYIDAE